MLTTRTSGREAGVTMLEVLITLVILAFGLLGLAGLHIKIQTLDMEAYQRAQAILLLRDMVERIKANSASAADYVPVNPATMYGSGYTHVPACPGATQVDRDICGWTEALKGAAESSSGTKVGAMIEARGCIQQIIPPDPSAGVCQPGTYRVTVAWQGLFATTAPVLSCGTGQYGVPVNEAIRRAISSDITIGLPTCM